MRIQHRAFSPTLTDNRDGLIEPEYEALVAEQTESRESRWRAAQRSLDAAQKRADSAMRKLERVDGGKAKRSAKRDLAVAWALVELRRQELDILQKLMTGTPAGTSHRGSSSYRRVPVIHGPLL